MGGPGLACPRSRESRTRLRRFAAGPELTLKWNAIVTLPGFVAVIAFGPEIAGLIYGDQWLPAVPALYVLAINNALIPINGLITPILNAVGKTKIVLLVSLGWAGAAWGVAVILMAFGVGFLAVPIGLAVSQGLAALVLLPIGRREFDLRLAHHLVRPLLAAVAAGLFGRFILLPLLTDAVLLIQGGIVVVAVYAALLFAIDRRALRTELGALWKRRTAVA